MHDPAPPEDEYLPAEHEEQLPEPAAAEVPALQVVQEEREEVDFLPAGQFTHADDEVCPFRLLYFPLPHVAHEDPDTYLPASHV